MVTKRTLKEIADYLNELHGDAHYIDYKIYGASIRISKYGDFKITRSNRVAASNAIKAEYDKVTATDLHLYWLEQL